MTADELIIELREIRAILESSLAVPLHCEQPAPAPVAPEPITTRSE